MTRRELLKGIPAVFVAAGATLWLKGKDTIFKSNVDPIKNPYYMFGGFNVYDGTRWAISTNPPDYVLINEEPCIDWIKIVLEKLNLDIIDCYKIDSSTFSIWGKNDFIDFHFDIIRKNNNWICQPRWSENVGFLYSDDVSKKFIEAYLQGEPITMLTTKEKPFDYTNFRNEINSLINSKTLLVQSTRKTKLAKLHLKNYSL